MLDLKRIARSTLLPLLLLPAPSIAEDGGPHVTSCEAIFHMVAGWQKQPPEWPDVELTAEVVSLEVQDPIAVTTLCPQTRTRVVCLEYNNSALKPGDRVDVSGLVSGTFEDGVVLDPCGTIKVEADEKT
ncbi:MULTISPECIES: hypothetical protein [Ensifer]|jgi:hypothetical protein|uniref:hypothetical protein n=1 Tax=Ensifer TaxID=106591 RepID=UPI00046C9718|nr:MULTISPECIES: hypothetical protein [Ensifer]MDP9630408.1 hypothetical protein [Ensifer adhaerens]KQU81259.1 hypothetical protein ASD00_35065 [Ensifer sp. Root31]KQW58322.1 hypothetical protein ASD02_04695 [Ensifer sp. Root1252]KQW62279.1 hypothetical protein ASD03_12800 [Ensifer sp. Root127]KQY65179.1 hypothetical protein ASD52_35370 [Ensifer sp. Root142]